MSTGHLPCNVIVELLTDYLEGALDPVTAASLEQHLAHCPPCATYLEQLRATIDVVGQQPIDTLADSARADLEAAFRGYRPPVEP